MADAIATSPNAVERFRNLLRTAEGNLQAGRVNDGIAAYNELLAIDPSYADGWYNRAYLERCARRYADAVASYRRAIENGVARPEEVHLNVAVILSEHLDRAADAECELRTAIDLNAGFLEAWLNLGNLYEDLGDAERARRAYRRAAAIAPGNGRAIGRGAAIEVFTGNAEAVIPQLTRQLADAATRPADRAEIGFALGQALDASGAYEDAFGAYVAANDASRSVSAAVGYDPAAQERLVDEIMSVFPLSAEATRDRTSPSPVFICGLFRSGSTLAENILARHSRVTAGGELEFIPAMVASQLQPYPEAARPLSKAHFETLQHQYLREMDSIFPGVEIVTDKRPDNFLHIGFIKSLFPAAKIVHTFRDPVDNILSAYFTNFDSGVPYGSRIEDLTHWYRQYRRLMAYWSDVYRGAIFHMDYDQLVIDPERQIRRCLEFCGLAWEPGCLAATPVGAPVRTPSAWQIRQPLYRSSSGRHANYPGPAREIERLLAQ